MLKHAACTLIATAAVATASLASAATTRADDDTHRYTVELGLNGYSPVSYLDLNRAEPGSPAFTSVHEGVTYFFTSDAQRRSFERVPDRYLPAYGGYCAFGCSVDATFVVDPTSFRIIEGRTHLFLKTADVDALQLWDDADAAEVKAKADHFWVGYTQSMAYVNSRNVPANGIGLDGFSPVSYFTVGKPEQGDARFAVTHNDVTYHLTSPKQVELFKANPAKYEPQCGGWCAFGMSVEDKFPIDPTSFRVVNDQLYVFLNNAQIDASDLWDQGDERALIMSANTHWKKVSGQ